MKKVLLRIVIGLEMFVEQLKVFNANFKDLLHYKAIYLEKSMAENLSNSKPAQEQDTNTDTKPEERYLESEMLTIKMVCAILKVSRTKLYDFKKKGKLKFYENPGGGIRLCPDEVEQLRYCYSIPKGKV